MASVSRYRKKWLKWKAQYEVIAFRELRKTFKQWVAQIPFDDLNVNNYGALISNSIDTDLMFDTYESIYSKVGLTHGKRVGRDINMQLKLFTLDDFTTTFLNDILIWLRGEGGARITLVEHTFIDDITNIIAQGLEDGESMRNVAKELQELVNRPDFYRWQAMRIARTETTAAANRAALVAGEVSGFIMQKIWISKIDKRTRRKPPSEFDHVDMNLVRVGLNEKFNVNGDLLDYPGDPSGEASDVINCRCTVALVPKRDQDGNLIST